MVCKQPVKRKQRHTNDTCSFKYEEVRIQGVDILQIHEVANAQSNTGARKIMAGMLPYININTVVKIKTHKYKLYNTVYVVYRDIIAKL